MEDLRAALMTGIDIPFVEAQLILHQPTAKEISYCGEKVFFTGIQLLCFNKSMLPQDESLLVNQSDFQIFMTVMSQPEVKEQKECVKKVLSLIFPFVEQVIFTPRSIMLGDKMIDESNFLVLQEILKEVFCLKTMLGQQAGFNPTGKKAKEIADKLQKARERVAKQQAGDNASMINQYISMLAVGLQLSIVELSQYTLYQLMDQIERFMLYLEWDLDIRAKMAGADTKKQPDNWMKNLH